MTYVGIDVSKDTFTVAYFSDKKNKTNTFKIHTVKGIHEFIQTISKEGTHSVHEATGNHSMLLIYLFSKEGITTSLDNPLKIMKVADHLTNYTDVY